MLSTLPFLIASGMAVDEPPVIEPALEAALVAYEQAMEEEDLQAVANMAPPGFFEAVAEEAGVPFEVLDQAMATQMAQTAALYEFEGVSVDRSQIVLTEGADATPIAYIPVTLSVGLNARGDEDEPSAPEPTEVDVIGLKVETVWYLRSLDVEGTLSAIERAYPGLGPLTVPMDEEEPRP